MTPLSSAAGALLADIAAAHGLDALEPDGDGLVPVEIGGQPLVLAFSAAWESVFLSAVLAADASALGPSPYVAFALPGLFAGPRTRVAREPRSGAVLLVAEIGLVGLHYPAFAAALTDFLADVRRAREELRLPLFTG